MKATGRTVACIGTGPSLTLEQVDTARDKGCLLFGCNLVFRLIPDLSVLYAVNSAFWDYYWPEVRDHPCEKWTTNKQSAEKYNINWIAEKNAPGLSQDPSIVHHGHGSGFTQVNLAYLMGAQRIVLLGYDLKYAPDYNGKTQDVGSTPRHYFGEYPAVMQHWPSVSVRDGVHVELLDLYRSVAKQGAVEIINCTPDSAIDCFPHMDISKL